MEYLLFLVLVALIYLVIHSHVLTPRQIERGHSDQQLYFVQAMATAINAKDRVTFSHVRRVQVYAEGLGRLAHCTKLELIALRKAAILHDLGKIAVPDHVLQKPGKLTAEEFGLMKVHPSVGAAILERVHFDCPIVPIVLHHHERWDGTGYPLGLRGEQIPLTARILSVADCFDAVREDRPYRKGLSRQEAIDLVMNESGTTYDPQLVGLFLTHLPQFEAQIQSERCYGADDFGVLPPTALSYTGLLTRPAAGLLESQSPQLVESKTGIQ